MLEALQQLGCEIKHNSNNTIIKSPEQFPKNVQIRLKDSATALRFLLARLAFEPGLISEIVISEQLLKRPHETLIFALRELGANIKISANRFKIEGVKPISNSIQLDGKISSQFVSALLLSAPLYPKGLTINLTSPPVSKSYIDMTCNIMQQFGITIKTDNWIYSIDQGQLVKMPKCVCAEPDASSAGYIWALGALSKTGSGVKFPNRESIQGDFQLLNFLEKMGADVIHNSSGILVQHNTLNGISVNMNDFPDAVPTVVFLALFAKGETKITGIEHLKYKESDRLNALVCELKRLDVEIKYCKGEMKLRKLESVPDSITLNSYGDHRLALVFDCLSLIFPQIKVSDKSVISKSFPQWKQIRSAFEFSTKSENKA